MKKQLGVLRGLHGHSAPAANMRIAELLAMLVNSLPASEARWPSAIIVARGRATARGASLGARAAWDKAFNAAGAASNARAAKAVRH